MLIKRSLVCLALIALTALATTTQAASSRKASKKRSSKKSDKKADKKSDKTTKSSVITAKGTIEKTELPPRKGSKRKRTAYVLKTAEGEYFISGSKASSLLAAVKEKPDATFEVTGRAVKSKDRQQLYVSSFKIVAQEKATEGKEAGQDKEGEE